jgi:hypothetical protein
MDESCTTGAAPAIELRRTVVRRPEQLFGNFGLAARAFWPEKTAERLAAAAKCSVRAAEFYLAGQRAWSDSAMAAVVAKLFERIPGERA